MALCGQRTLHFHCPGRGFIPWWGNEFPASQAVWSKREKVTSGLTKNKHHSLMLSYARVTTTKLQENSAFPVLKEPWDSKNSSCLLFFWLCRDKKSQGGVRGLQIAGQSLWDAFVFLFLINPKLWRLVIPAPTEQQLSHQTEPSQHHPSGHSTFPQPPRVVTTRDRTPQGASAQVRAKHRSSNGDKWCHPGKWQLRKPTRSCPTYPLTLKPEPFLFRLHNGKQNRAHRISFFSLQVYSTQNNLLQLYWGGWPRPRPNPPLCKRKYVSASVVCWAPGLIITGEALKCKGSGDPALPLRLWGHLRKLGVRTPTLDTHTEQDTLPYTHMEAPSNRTRSCVCHILRSQRRPQRTIVSHRELLRGSSCLDSDTPCQGWTLHLD